jgi:hypothetical protein
MAKASQKITSKPKQLRAIDEMKDRSIPIPWSINRFLGLDGKLLVCGEQVSLSKRGDFGTLEEVRSVVEWLAHQFGGQVKWE